MAIYNTGYVSLLLTKEGAARANQLKENGIELKVSHMRVYRSPTLIQNLPHQFNGSETRAVVNSWACFPNHETTFEVIEDFDNTSPNGELKLIGTLGADVGTFSYDAVGLFLEDDTLYAIGATSRLLTKRKAYIGSSANIHELRFNLGHETVKELARFIIDETIVDYSRITEVQYVHELPNIAIPKEVIYRVTNGYHQTYQTGTSSFRTWLASQRRKTIGSLSDTVWVLHDHIKLFDRMDLNFTIHSGKLHLSIPISKRYPLDLIPTDREVIVCFFNPNKSVTVPSAMKFKMESRSSDSTVQTLTFAPVDIGLVGIQEYTQVRGTVYLHGSDCIYQDAIQSAIKTMTEIQYSAGRKLQTDDTDLDPNIALQPLWGRNSIWKKLDGMIFVATSDFDGRLFNPSQMQPIVYKPGGTKHVDLRATRIWLNSENGNFQPTLTVDKPLVVYGQTFRATITAPNVKAGTQLPWYVRTPDKNGILLAPTQTVGYVTLDANGVGYIDFTVNWNAIDSQYLVYIGLIGYNIERIVTITQLEAEIYYSSDSAGNERITNADEGETVYLCTKANYPFNGLQLYLKRQPGSSVDDYDFEDLLPDSVILQNGKSATPLRIKADLLTEGAEVLIYGLYANADRTRKLGADAILTIADTSTTQEPIYQMFFSNAQASDVPLTVDSELGDVVWLVVKATNVPSTHNVTLRYAGDIDRVVDIEPDLPETVSMVLTNGRGAYRINTIKPTITPPDGPIKRTLTIASNRTSSFNIYNEFVTAFGTPSGDLEVTVKVENGVYVVGTDTANPAIDGRGNWNPGAILKVDNYGHVLGRGGKGGARSITTTNTDVPGGNGGPAIVAQDSHPIYVTNHIANSATVAGGGGGSGGAYQFIWYSYDEAGNISTGSQYADHWSIGGGGGAPLGQNHIPPVGENPGAPGGTSEGRWLPIACNDSTLTSPGNNSVTLNAIRGEILAGPINISGGNVGNSGSLTGLSSSGKRSADGNAGPISLGPVYINAI